MMNSDDPQLPRSVLEFWPIVWPLLGGLGGAIISLGLARNEAAAPKKKAFQVIVGTIAAVFLGPLVVRYTLGVTTRGDSEMVGAIYCLVGLSATSVIERVVRIIAGWIDRIPVPPVKEAE
jgi:hypothetical protein